MKELWHELSRHMAWAGLQGAPSSMRPSRSRRYSQAAQLHELTHLLWNHEQGRLPNGQGKTLQQDDLNHGNNIPNQGAGVDQGGTKVPCQNAKGNPHHHPLVPQGLVLQVSNCVSICQN